MYFFHFCQLWVVKVLICLWLLNIFTICNYLYNLSQNENVFFTQIKFFKFIWFIVKNIIEKYIGINEYKVAPYVDYKEFNTIQYTTYICFFKIT